VDYIPAQTGRHYYSYISRDEYNISENVTIQKAEKLATADPAAYRSTTITVTRPADEIVYDPTIRFCSYECCLRFIISQGSSGSGGKYRLSRVLFYEMLMADGLDATAAAAINPAPPVGQLRCFGGPLSYEEYRSKFTGPPSQRGGPAPVEPSLEEPPAPAPAPVKAKAPSAKAVAAKAPRTKAQRPAPAEPPRLEEPPTPAPAPVKSTKAPTTKTKAAKTVAN
jgi:hypothetical protein